MEFDGKREFSVKEKPGESSGDCDVDVIEAEGAMPRNSCPSGLESDTKDYQALYKELEKENEQLRKKNEQMCHQISEYESDRNNSSVKTIAFLHDFIDFILDRKSRKENQTDVDLTDIIQRMDDTNRLMNDLISRLRREMKSNPRAEEHTDSGNQDYVHEMESLRQELESEREKCRGIEKNLKIVSDELNEFHVSLGDGLSSYHEICGYLETDGRGDAGLNIRVKNLLSYLTFCSSDARMKKLHEDLANSPNITTPRYREVAWRVLDFCMWACGEVKGKKYTRMGAKPGNHYSKISHDYVGTTSPGPVSTVREVFLDGIMVDGSVFCKAQVSITDEGCEL